MLHSLTRQAEKDDSEADGREWWCGGFCTLTTLCLSESNINEAPAHEVREI
jgi:hypothetical protein